MNILKNITADIIVDFVKTNKIELKSAQKKLCVPIINRIYKKMKAGVRFSAIKVDNDIICDGHHRYLASLLADYALEYSPASRTSATIPIEWPYVIFVEEDWDTIAKIQMLNEYDAQYNNIPLTEILELLK
jgi:hypothetical protein